jgi:hypothetical protein
MPANQSEPHTYSRCTFFASAAALLLFQPHRSSEDLESSVISLRAVRCSHRIMHGLRRLGRRHLSVIPKSLSTATLSLTWPSDHSQLVLINAVRKAFRPSPKRCRVPIWMTARKVGTRRGVIEDLLRTTEPKYDPKDLFCYWCRYW